jgi:hypothetical protein
LAAITPKAVSLIKEAKNSKNNPIVERKIDVLFVPSNLKTDKITLFDSYEKVTKVLGKPISVADNQNMITTITFPDGAFKECQFLLYENFFVIVGNGGVVGWYLNPNISNNKNSSFYLPTLTSGESKTFLDFYKSWENFSSNSYSDAFSGLKKFDFGEIYSCLFYTDPDSGKEIFNFDSENKTFKIHQMYTLEEGKLILKYVGMLDENLIKNAESYSFMFLNKTKDYVKKYFGTATVKRDGEIIDENLKKIKVLSLLTEDGTLYRFTFDPITLKCSSVAIQPNFQ